MRINVNELPERYKRQVAAQIGVSGPAADLEPHPGYAPLRAQAPARFDGPVVIRFVEYRHRLADPDGACVKYLLDALVSAGVLPDDSVKFVKKVEKEQVKAGPDEPERTVVEIYEGIC